MLNTGDHFQLTDDAIENYGEQWRDIVFRVTSWANKYTPANVYFANPSAYPYSHPGYDGNGRERLYDSEPLDTDLEFNCSVYDWEVRKVYID
jgi:hypothetical protein